MHIQSELFVYGLRVRACRGRQASLFLCASECLLESVVYYRIHRQLPPLFLASVIFHVPLSEPLFRNASEPLALKIFKCRAFEVFRNQKFRKPLKATSIRREPIDCKIYFRAQIRFLSTFYRVSSRTSCLRTAQV